MLYKFTINGHDFEVRDSDESRYQQDIYYLHPYSGGMFLGSTLNYDSHTCLLQAVYKFAQGRTFPDGLTYSDLSAIRQRARDLYTKLNSGFINVAGG